MVNCDATRLGLSTIFLSFLLFAQTELIEKNIQFINQNNPILKENNPENLSFFLISITTDMHLLFNFNAS